MDPDDRLLAEAMVPTREPLRELLAAVIAAAVADGAVRPDDIRWAMLGTTHAMNGALERPDLKQVAAVRIGAPLTRSVPPLATWPQPLREKISAGEVIVRGGSEYDGAMAAELDEDAIARFLESCAGRIDGVAITGVFAPVAPDHELAAADVVRRELGSDLHVSLSHEIGTIGLLERENATVLNAALIDPGLTLASGLRDALAAAGIGAELFFTQNDGTLMAFERALRFPVLMLDAGPATSMRGAAHLSGAGDALVVNAGATATVIGVLMSGTPRESSRPELISGVRLSLHRADVRTLPVGGAAIAGGGGVALAAAVAQVAAAYPLPPLVVIGGAGSLVPSGLPGVSQVIRPHEGHVAHAIGAATAVVSAQAERICADQPDRREAALADARAAALTGAVHAGADPGAVAVIEVEEVPLTQLVVPAIRIRVKAAGPRA
ncbi:MAG: hypothetical protein QOG15_3689 [Solirubrobacteraceae bacterium]|nr:hypothetical protein [Solirubrobacteraceae bacterium]